MTTPAWTSTAPIGIPPSANPCSASSIARRKASIWRIVSDLVRVLVGRPFRVARLVTGTAKAAPYERPAVISQHALSTPSVWRGTPFAPGASGGLNHAPHGVRFPGHRVDC